MSQKSIRPYRSWTSPLTSELTASSTIGLVELRCSLDAIYWLEMRPTEQGRYVIMRWCPDTGARAINPAPYNARTRVHDYGGGHFVADTNGVYFANFSDQRIYRQSGSSTAEPVTANGHFRIADMVIDARRQRLISVCEHHSEDGSEPANYLASIDIPADPHGEPLTLTSGADLYASPRLNPRGDQLA